MCEFFYELSVILLGIIPIDDFSIRHAVLGSVFMFSINSDDLFE